ncbi:hypothetical protein TNCV_3232751 [Trichonephila clavipes]|nr:hypothetical protein TNCV_3232751 [Trichonephila clavipes]
MACDAEDCGFQILNDDEIVTFVQEETNHVDDETDDDEDNNDNSKRPSNADAFSALDSYGVVRTTISAEHPTELMLLNRIILFSEKMKVYNGTAKNKLLFSSIKNVLQQAEVVVDFSPAHPRPVEIPMSALQSNY